MLCHQIKTGQLGRDFTSSHQFPLIAACLAKIEEQKVKSIIMILPYWPGKVWFSRFMQMAVEVRRLPPCKSLICDLSTGNPPQDVSLCHLVVAVLSGSYNTAHSSSKVRQETWWRHHGGLTQSQHIPQDGTSGLVGHPCMRYKNIRLV